MSLQRQQTHTRPPAELGLHLAAMSQHRTEYSRRRRGRVLRTFVAFGAAEPLPSDEATFGAGDCEALWPNATPSCPATPATREMLAACAVRCTPNAAASRHCVLIASRQVANCGLARRICHVLPRSPWSPAKQCGVVHAPVGFSSGAVCSCCGQATSEADRRRASRPLEICCSRCQCCRPFLRCIHSFPGPMSGGGRQTGPRPGLAAGPSISPVIPPPPSRPILPRSQQRRP